jgi:phospholipid/cholesterol/gamma-HCH transport system permease protein
MPTMVRIAMPGEVGRSWRLASVRWLTGWWRIVHLGAVLLVLALSPASYRGPMRAKLAHQLWQGTAPTVLWFTFASALAGVVLIRIVIVTAQSYGLTQYALEMVVRVLVLELIPLAAALFVALRYTLPQGTVLAQRRLRDAPQHKPAMAIDLMRDELLPQVLAGMFAVLMLAAVSCVVALVIAYLMVYGLSPWGFGAYTRTVGHIFNPAVVLIFSLKTLFFSVTVALIPAASALYDAPGAGSAVAAELRALVRMFALLLVIEAVSLMGNYY